ncbi:MAG TPA: VWA domain-containing protein [Candidatus Acidoferrum sp.]|nr:VWA domain-containing protein [Candidatus Acidoferrum sp.]
MKATASVRVFLILLLVFSACAIVPSAAAQSQTGPQTSAQPPQQAPPTQAAPGQQQPPPSGGVSIAVEVPIVTLDVVATTNHGDIITGLKRENFRVYEDGVPQTITSFGPTDSPITMVVLMEFSARYYGYFSQVGKYWADALFPNLKQQDWVALVTFDMRPHLEVDFTQNKEEVRNALFHLYFPGFSESNVFDAVLDTVNRLKDVKGKKSILLICTGRDTFSKHTLDQTIKQLRQTDVTIFAVGLSRYITNALEMNGYHGSEINFVQDQNQLSTFAKETGGNAWFPQFDGELPGIFQEVAAFLRNQYSLTYTPTNRARDGSYRKIKVDLVAPDGSPLIVLNQKKKKQKYEVYVRQGYVAPKGAD